MSELACETVAERGLLECYVAGTLQDEDARALEKHFLQCRRCQADIKVIAGVREELQAPVASRLTRGRWTGLTAAALAAAVVAVMVFPRHAAREPLTRLGAMGEPPIYLGVPVRNEITHIAFDSAMRVYERRDYRQAAELLTRVRGSDSVPALFFRASSLLLLGKARQASAEYARVIAAGHSPYVAEARFYRAKALLLEGQGAEALVELHSIHGDDEIAVRARLLGDSVRGLER